MKKARARELVAPPYNLEIAVNQDRQAKALNITRKVIRVLREHGVIDYPMTIEQYETLAPLFCGIGTTEIVKAILAGISKPRREKLIKTAGMGQMEAYSYGYCIRFRIENLHVFRARCSCWQWRQDLMTKFPKGTKWLVRSFYEKSMMQAKNAVQYALRKGPEEVEALAKQFGLELREYDGVFINKRKTIEKAQRKERAKASRKERLGR
jgi:hypothetical protein